MVEKKRILVVCLGNICRSPIGEAVFRRLIEENALQDKWEVDSAALVGYHTGKSPDRRAMSVLEEKGITNYSHRARPITKDDFTTYDWIFGMDEENIESLNRAKPVRCKASIELLGKYDPRDQLIIRDPYYDDDSAGFVEAYEQCLRSATRFLEQREKE